MLPKIPSDIKEFAKHLESIKEEDEKILASTPQFYDLNGSSELSDWRERCKAIFKLFEVETKIQDEDEDEEGEEEEEEEEEDEEGSQVFAKLNEQKIVEIEDEIELEQIEIEIKKTKQTKPKKSKEEAKKIKEHNEWQKYYHLRSQLIKDFEEEKRADEDGVYNAIHDNVKSLLSETSFSQEVKDIFFHNVIVRSQDSTWEDVDELRNISVSSTIFSLVTNACIDLNFFYHRRVRWSTVEFETELVFDIKSPATREDKKEEENIWEKNKAQKIYRCSLVDLSTRRVTRMKEDRKFYLTLKHIKEIRKALFGNVKELNSGITDIQLMDVLCASCYAHYREFTYGTKTGLSGDDYFGYMLRLTCKASTLEDESFVEMEQDFDEDEGEDYDEDYDEEYDDEDGPIPDLPPACQHQ